MTTILVRETHGYLRVVLKGVLVGSLDAVEGVRILVAGIRVHRWVLDVEPVVALCLPVAGRLLKYNHTTQQQRENLHYKESSG